MKVLSPLVWREGMHLAQHHFQLQSRYFEDLSSFTLESLFFQPYGLAGIELDREALLNGTVTLHHAWGIMPDGLPFTFPEDPPPQPLEIREVFAPTRESHLVLLVIPPYRAGYRNCGDMEDEPLDGSDAEARFRMDSTSVADELTGQDEKPVYLARKNFTLALEGKEPADAVVLPLARVRRDGAGNFVYDHTYIPPVVRIGASRALMEIVARLVDMLSAKADALRGSLITGDGTAEPSSSELVRFWLSHTIQETLPLLAHHLQSRSAHPERLYRDMAKLAGALCTFSIEAHPRDLPAYDPDDLAGVFGSLEAQIRGQLDLSMPARAHRFPFEAQDELFYRAAVPDPAALASATWHLEVRGDMPRAALIDAVTRLVKICSGRYIRRIVSEANPGATLEHVTRPPAGVAPRADAEYFRVVRQGAAWSLMTIPRDREDPQGVGIYVPQSVPPLSMTLVVLSEV